jgi:hypothetical protein
MSEANELDFEPGSKWRMRGGEIATVYGSKAGTENIVAYWGDRMSVFRSDGAYWFHDEESEFDLIEPAESAAVDEVAQ